MSSMRVISSATETSLRTFCTSQSSEWLAQDACYEPVERTPWGTEVRHSDHAMISWTTLPPSGSGQAVVAAVVVERELVVWQTEKMQDRGVQIAEVDFAFHRSGSRIVGSSVDVSLLDAAAGQPKGKAVGIVAGFVLAVVGRQTGPSELAAPDDQRVVEQSACGRDPPAMRRSVRRPFRSSPSSRGGDLCADPSCRD